MKQIQINLNEITLKRKIFDIHTTEHVAVKIAASSRGRERKINIRV